jgi:D-tyrosyl-tRNA(Tyr) deacylase
MIALIQRVSEARVAVAGETIGAIGQGILVLVGVAPGDTVVQGERLLEKLLSYRIFADNAGKMNLDVRQIKGELLLVPQFTLLADTSQGMRPGFSGAASPAVARERFEGLVIAARARHPGVACGQFGADMQVHLVNDGPVTFWLEV